MSDWYPNSKVYSDGFHYIAIPYEPNPSAKHKRVRVEEVVEVEDQKAAEKEQTEDEETDACEEETPAENKTSTESSKERRCTTRKDEFERLYRESLELKPCKRKRYILEEMKKLFPKDEKIGNYDMTDGRTKNALCWQKGKDLCGKRTSIILAILRLLPTTTPRWTRRHSKGN